VGRISLRGHRRRGRRSRYIRRRLYAFNRNPGGGGLLGGLKRAFTPYAAGFVMSMVAAVADKAMARFPAAKAFTKLGLAIATIMLVGKRSPAAAAGAIGSLAASTGYVWGTRLAGGIVATTPEAAVQGLGAMYQDYPMEMGALLNGLGVLTGPDDVEPAVQAYESALRTGGYDDDY
jgi:hypothetical protein